MAFRGKVSQPEAQPLAQSIVQVQHDTIMMTETIRDTVYQTRIVTRYAQPVIAQQTADTQQSSPDQQLSAEQMACSMLVRRYSLRAAGHSVIQNMSQSQSFSRKRHKYQKKMRNFVGGF